MEDSFERYSENYYDVIVYCHCVLELITRFLKRLKKKKKKRLESEELYCALEMNAMEHTH